MTKTLSSLFTGVLILPLAPVALIFPSAVIVPPILAGLGVLSWKVPILVWLFIAPTVITQIIAFVLLFRWDYL